jgi:hypothetical protein
VIAGFRRRWRIVSATLHTGHLRVVGMNRREIPVLTLLKEIGMNGKTMLYVDQFGNRWFARTVAELRQKIGYGRVSKMYVDGIDGKTSHIGYVVGGHWCEAFVPMRNPA